MFPTRWAATIATVLLLSGFIHGQKTDLAFSAGATFASDAHEVFNPFFCTGSCPLTISTLHRVFLEGTGAIRLANFRLASLYVELPVAVVPSAPMANTAGTSKMTSIFVTPSLRVRFVPAAPISPFASVGGGWAHYHVTDETSSSGALQFGGGLDFPSGIPRLGFRVEARDFVTGQPNFGFLETLVLQNRKDTSRRHNLLAGGGMVLRF